LRALYRARGKEYTPQNTQEKTKSAPEALNAAPTVPPESQQPATPQQDAEERAPTAYPDTSQIDPEDYINLRRLNISPEEKENLAGLVKETVAGGRYTKQKVTFADIEKEAAALDPRIVRNLKPVPPGQTLRPEVRFAARERLNTLNAESVRLQKELADKYATAPLEEIEELETRLAHVEHDAKGMLDVLIPTRSQDGRNLAFAAMMAQQSFDVEYWLSRARRIAERSGEDLTSKRYQAKEQKIRTVLADGSQWENRIKSLEEQVSELRSKLKDADSGKPPVVPSETKKPFRRKAESLQATLDAQAEAARIRITQFFNQDTLHDVTDIARIMPDLAIFGAAKLARKGITATLWAQEMASDIGGQIRPYLKGIYRDAYTIYRDEAQRIKEEAKVNSVTEGEPESYTEQEIERLLTEKAEATEKQRHARAQLARVFANLEKTHWADTASAFIKAGLLTGPKTHARNIGGNTAYQVFDEVSRIPAVIADLVVSAASGRRSITGPDPLAVAKSSYEAATKGVREAVEILKHGGTADELAKFDIHKEVNSGWRVLDAYINGVFRVMSAEDKVFRTYALRRSLEDQAKVMAKNEVKQGTIERGEWRARAKELAKNPTGEMAAQAVLDSEVATFNNNTALSNALTSFKTKIGPAGRFAIDRIMPFTRTPANILTRLLEATPLGGAYAVTKSALDVSHKNFTLENQRAFSQTMGRSVTGSGVLVLGYMLAAAGYATGLSDDEPSKNERDKAAGRVPMAIRLGDTWHQVGPFSPLGNLIAVGATFHRERHQELTDESQRLMKLVKFSSQTVLTQPMLQGLSNLTDFLEDPGREGASFLGGLAGSLVPTIVSDVATLTDDEKRDTSARGLVSGIKARVQSRIPFLRERLPVKRDVFGQKTEFRRSAAIDPTLASTAKETYDGLIKELIRLDVGVPKSKRKPGEQEEDYRKRTIAEGRLMEEAGRQLIASDEYKEAKDEQKQEGFKSVFEYAKRELTKAAKEEKEDAGVEVPDEPEKLNFKPELDLGIQPRR